MHIIIFGLQAGEFASCQSCKRVLSAEDKKVALYTQEEKNDVLWEKLNSACKPSANKLAFVQDIKDLVCAGANPNMREFHYYEDREDPYCGNTLLSSYIDNAGMVAFLLNHGARLDYQSTQGSHYILQTSNVEVAKCLLEHGTSVNARDEYKNNALHMFACFFYKKDRKEVAKLLIDRGACVNAQDWHKRTPLHILMLEGLNYDSLKNIKKKIEVLFQKKVDESLKDYTGNTALDILKNRIEIWENPDHMMQLIHGTERITKHVGEMKVILAFLQKLYAEQQCQIYKYELSEKIESAHVDCQFKVSEDQRKKDRRKRKKARWKANRKRRELESVKQSCILQVSTQ